jgi:predicted TIM-barrel fold metal-dependent hydrolase
MTGRRGFLGKAASAAMVPLMLQGGSETAQANNKNLSAEPQQSAKAKIKRIAVEEHWGTAEFARNQGMTPAPWIYETRLPASPEKTQKMQDLGEVRLADMDEAGITMQVIAAGWIEAQRDISTAIDMAKKTNDSFAQQIGKHPDRFAGFAALPLQDPESVRRRIGTRGETAWDEGHNDKRSAQPRISRCAEMAGALGTLRRPGRAHLYTSCRSRSSHHGNV